MTKRDSTKMLSFFPAVILKTLRQIGRSELKKKRLVTSLRDYISNKFKAKLDLYVVFRSRGVLPTTLMSLISDTE